MIYRTLLLAFSLYIASGLNSQPPEQLNPEHLSALTTYFELEDGNIIGADSLVLEITESQFLSLGELHNRVQLSRFTTALLDTASAFSFHYFAIETSPYAAEKLEPQTEKGIKEVPEFYDESSKTNTEKSSHQSIGQLRGLTLAAHQMPEMIEFYTHVFEIEFSELSIQEYILYKSEWLGLKLLICPAEFAANTAEQTRHQLDIAVTDFDSLLAKVTRHGGALMGDIRIQKEMRSIGILDPDGNSMIIIETPED